MLWNSSEFPAAEGEWRSRREVPTYNEWLDLGKK